MRAYVMMVAVVTATTTIPVLPVQAAPGGSYMQSCNSIRDDGRGQMSAQCRDVRGRYNYSSLDYRSCQGDIGNNNGQLFCNGGRPGTGVGGGDRPGNGWGGGRPGGGWGGGNWSGGNWSGGDLPRGSWRDTCRPSGMRGSMLTARCENMNGRWTDTGIDMRSCDSNRLKNRDGRLVCD